MKQFWEMFKLVRWVNQSALSLKEAEGYIRPTGINNKWVNPLLLKIEYIKKTKKSSDFVDNLIESSIEAGYLKRQNLGGGDYLCVSAVKGRKLIDIPMGFIEEFLSEYNKAAVFVLGILTAVITKLVTLVPQLIKFLAEKK